MNVIKSWAKKLLDIFLYPFTWLAARWFKMIVSKGIFFFPVSRSIFMKVGVLPVPDNYYYPMINPEKYLRMPLEADRDLPGIDLNPEGQLALLKQFVYRDELSRFPVSATAPEKTAFYYGNGMFGPGDAEILYSMIRHFKPRRVIEVGSGHSTLMALQAVAANKKDNAAHDCKITCIEPFEIPWLEKLDVELKRMVVERLDLSFFDELEENDILFIDSSHVIRPQGDVLYEYLQLLPRLKPGVIVHVHDIFTPRDYPSQWVIRSHNMWNEQYLLEAFLTGNKGYTILSALHYLFHHHRAALEAACPVLAQDAGIEPRSFWIRKN